MDKTDAEARIRAEVEDAVLRLGKAFALAIAQSVIDDIERNGISVEGGETVVDSFGNRWKNVTVLPLGRHQRQLCDRLA